MCGVHVLPSGHLAIGVYSAYKKGGEAGLFGITRDKKFVWCYSNPKSDGSMMSIQMLDQAGKPLPGRTVRESPLPPVRILILVLVDAIG